MVKSRVVPEGTATLDRTMVAQEALDLLAEAAPPEPEKVHVALEEERVSNRLSQMSLERIEDKKLLRMALDRMKRRRRKICRKGQRSQRTSLFARSGAAVGAGAAAGAQATREAAARRPRKTEEKHKVPKECD